MNPLYIYIHNWPWLINYLLWINPVSCTCIPYSFIHHWLIIYRILIPKESMYPLSCCFGGTIISTTGSLGCTSLHHLARTLQTTRAVTRAVTAARAARGPCPCVSDLSRSEKGNMTSSSARLSIHVLTYRTCFGALFGSPNLQLRA